VRFLADECCDTGLVMSLRGEGHDVLYVLEGKAGVSDDEVLTEAYIEERILVTEDKDFDELKFTFCIPTIYKSVISPLPSVLRPLPSVTFCKQRQ